MHPLYRYQCIIAYDGTDYDGWQIQPDRHTIEQVLAHTFEKTFAYPIKIRGASRTDAGVHALGQVALIETPLEIAPEQLCAAWNNVLPMDIRVRRVNRASDTFNPRVACKKTYFYHFFTRSPLPIVQRYGWFMRYPVDMEKLQQSLAFLQGTHDFKSFCTGDNHGNSTIRTIDHVSLEYIKRYKIFRIAWRAPRFMRHMIRRMVGTVMNVAMRPNMQPADVQVILQAHDPQQAIFTAPAQGLMLYKICYADRHVT